MEKKKTGHELALDRVKFEVGQEIGIAKKKRTKTKEK